VSSDRPNRLVLVPGHAVWLASSPHPPESDGAWILQEFQRGEPPFYIEHIRFGVELAKSCSDALLIFSGGMTRREAGPVSEAQSYRDLAARFGWLTAGAITEEYARDSFENLLFSIARFREIAGRDPGSIEVVGWGFKEARFDLHRTAIRWPEQSFTYHGINDPDDLIAAVHAEAKVRDEFARDPFGTGELLSAKREARNPFARRSPYSP
jgi:hypothetical protein